MKCPYCNGELSSINKFCPYCGTNLSEDLRVHITNETINKTEILDHGKVAEANVKNSKIVEKTKRRKGCLSSFVIVSTSIIVGFVLIIMILAYINNSEERNDNKENARLQIIEAEILEDIRNERYEQALVKAQLLRFSLDGSISSELAWDHKRSDLIRTINALLNPEPIPTRIE